MICSFSKILELVSWYFKENISLCILLFEKEFKVLIFFYTYKRGKIGNGF